MYVWFVWGEVGAGKGITCVMKAQEYLKRGCRVATNMNLNLEYIQDVNEKRPLVTRLPDKPTISDLESVGLGYQGDKVDKSKYGLMVLDELGTWFNARTWNEKGRKELIEYMIHIRKRRWHLMIQVQDVDMLDKQLRGATGMFEVQCKNLLNFKVPFINILVRGYAKLFDVDHIQLSVVKKDKLVQDRWWQWNPERLYRAYDTEQNFYSRDSANAVMLHTVLPPYYTKGRYIVPRTFNDFIKSNSKQLMVANMFAIVSAIAVSVYAINVPKQDIFINQPAAPLQTVQETIKKAESEIKAPQEIQQVTASDAVLECNLDMYISMSWQVRGEYGYVLTDGEKNLSSKAPGTYQFKPVDLCNVQLTHGQCTYTVTCDMPDTELDRPLARGLKSF